MLRVDNSNFSFNGACVVDDNMVASFNASYNGADDLYFNVSVPSITALSNNKAAFDTDFIAFKDHVMAVIEDVNDGQ